MQIRLNKNCSDSLHSVHCQDLTVGISIGDGVENDAILWSCISICGIHREHWGSNWRALINICRIHGRVEDR